MHQLYISVALPRMLYGIDIWFSPPHTEPGKKHRSGSAGPLRKLESIQRIATLAITGALRTTPTDLLDLHANLLPVDLAIEKACYRSLVRISSLPPSHPLHHIIREYHEDLKVQLPKHPTNLHFLLRTFNFVPSLTEIVAPVTDVPEWLKAFTTEIATSRTDSIAHEIIDDADVAIYTDGSKVDSGGVGASAVTLKRGYVTPSNRLRFFLGNANQHTSYEAEAIGLLLAAWSIFRERNSLSGRIAIYVDNQAIIQAIVNPKAKSAQYIIDELLRLMEESRRAFDARPAGTPTSIKIAWISAHSGVAGNELADGEAKLAALGKTSTPLALPELLRKRLPINASALKQDFADKLKRKWRSRWRNSPRYNCIA